MRKKIPAGFSTIELLIILVVAGVLVAFIASKYSAVQQKSRNDERRADINSLQFAAQSYFAQTGQYPTAAQFNSAGFRKVNLPSLPNGSIQDPQWSPAKPCNQNGQPVLETTAEPVAGCYGYAASPAGCDNKTTNCATYKLSGRLEGGGFYTKSSGD